MRRVAQDAVVKAINDGYILVIEGGFGDIIFGIHEKGEAIFGVEYGLDKPPIKTTAP